jgi:hypothetical protein
MKAEIRYGTRFNNGAVISIAKPLSTHSKDNCAKRAGCLKQWPTEIAQSTSTIFDNSHFGSLAYTDFRRHVYLNNPDAEQGINAAEQTVV